MQTDRSVFFLSLVLSVIIVGSEQVSAQIQRSYGVECIGNISPECSEQLKFREQLDLAKEKVAEAGLYDCQSYFSRFAPPSDGYIRFMDNNTCSSIDYPKHW